MLPRPVIVLPLAFLAGEASAQVEIEGVDGELRENVEQYIEDRPDCDAGEDAVTRFAEALPQTLRPAMEAFGYYDAGIDVEALPPDEECWRLRVSIEPGEPVTVREVNVELRGDASSDPRMQALADMFPLPPGSMLHHGRYRAFRDRVEALARQRGYMDGRFAEARIDVYTEQRAADITLVYDAGPRYGFGEVTFESRELSADVLRSFIPFSEGEPYDAELIARLRRDLIESDYFASAAVEIGPPDPGERRVPVQVETVPSEATSYSIGVGYSTDDGPRLRLSYEDRRRNVAGHQLQGEMLVSEVEQYVSLDYRTPVGNPQRDWRSYRLSVIREDIEAGVGAAARTGVRRTQVGEQLTTTRFLDLLIEQDEIAGREFSTQLVVPGISWARSRRDDVLRPREGHRASLALTAGVGPDVSLLQADLRGKWITALPWDARVLIRGRVGALAERGELRDVPLTMLFFAGGDNSIRGYDYRSVGPRTERGLLIGGSRVLEGSAEYEHPLLESWSLATFVDAGDAFRGSDFELRTGVGIGARWFSPIGPVRLDVAWPLDDEDRSVRLHLSLGPDL